MGILDGCLCFYGSVGDYHSTNDVIHNRFLVLHVMFGIWFVFGVYYGESAALTVLCNSFIDLYQFY